MSDEIINDHLRNWSFPYNWAVRPNTTISQNPSRTVRQSFVHDAHDWMDFTINLGQLTGSQKDDVIDFLMAIGFNIESFLFRDLYGVGYQVARQTIGSKPGAGGISLQMIRTHTVGGDSRDYDIYNIENNGTFDLWIGGSLQTITTDYTVNWLDDGTIDITSTDTGTVEAECDYLRRVRVMGDFAGALRTYDLNDLALVLGEEGVG